MWRVFTRFGGCEAGKLAQPINAKIETAGEKLMFRHALRKARVLVSASGFFEWKPVAGHKQPFFVRPAADEFFALGGLLEHWQGGDGPLWFFAILTTAANELMAPIHDRMPVIVRPDDYAAWLDPDVTNAGIVRELAEPYPADLMRAYPVGRSVGNPRSQGPQLAEQVDRVGLRMSDGRLPIGPVSFPKVGAPSKVVHPSVHPTE